MRKAEHLYKQIYAMIISFDLIWPKLPISDSNSIKKNERCLTNDTDTATGNSLAQVSSYLECNKLNQTNNPALVSSPIVQSFRDQSEDGSLGGFSLIIYT